MAPPTRKMATTKTNMATTKTTSQSRMFVSTIFPKKIASVLGASVEATTCALCRHELLRLLDRLLHRLVVVVPDLLGLALAWETGPEHHLRTRALVSEMWRLAFLGHGELHSLDRRRLHSLDLRLHSLDRRLHSLDRRRLNRARPSWRCCRPLHRLFGFVLLAHCSQDGCSCRLNRLFAIL